MFIEILNIIYHFVGIAEEDVIQVPVLGFGAHALELVVEELKAPESHDIKVLVVAVTFLQLAVATINAVQSIVNGAGTTGILARLLVEEEAQCVHGIT